MMKMLSDAEILAVASPHPRDTGPYITGPYFVLQKRVVAAGIEAAALLDWSNPANGERNIPRIGKRVFVEGGIGSPSSLGVPVWNVQLEKPNAQILGELSLDSRIQAIAEDYLSDAENKLSSASLRVLSNLKQTLESAQWEQEQILNICFCLYQKTKRRNREQNEKEARELDSALERLNRECNGKPDNQSLQKFLEERALLPGLEEII